MLNFLKKALSGESAAAQPKPANEAPPSEIAIGTVRLQLAEHMEQREGFPLLDWDAVQAWTSALPAAALRAQAWTAAEQAWMQHMRAALGEGYRIDESDTAMLLSTLPPRQAQRALDFMARSEQRVLQVLDGLGALEPQGKSLLIVFRDDESYYRYVSCYYPQDGEFAFSSGMYISAGCSHFVSAENDLRVVEPVIVHEMTHGCLAHLPLPAWLNEGLAVSVEQRLSPTPPDFTPQQLRQMHAGFWGAAEVQEFWSGKSFLRSDEGNHLSYALGRLMVEQLSGDWAAFKRFVLSADAADAGAAAAREHLGIGLGAALSALLEQTNASAWEPDARRWEGAPERGAFRAPTPSAGTGQT